MSSEKIKSLKAKKLCYNCIGEPFLKSEVRKTGNQLKCSYCNKLAPAHLLSSISERIDKAFQTYYFRTSNQPDSWEFTLLADKESNYEWERHGEPVIDAIMNSCGIPEEAASDIQYILEEKYDDFEAAKMGAETDFSSDSYYDEKHIDDSAWHSAWAAFEQSLQREARFFSQSASTLLHTIFDGIDRLKTRKGRSLIISAGPQTELNKLYRARVFQSDEKLKDALIAPDIKLGPPSYIDATAGRMNAHGISVFYGATTPEVALAEVRPPVGSRVVIAPFAIIRPLLLLDLTAFNDIDTRGSIFDPDYIDILERSKFLRTLTELITKPIMPERQPLDYLATQAVADFLASNPKISLDGIVFPSVQVTDNALNVVLFHKASRVEKIESEPNITIHASTGYWTEEGWEEEFSIAERVSANKERKKTENDEFFVVNENENIVLLGGDEVSYSNTLKIDIQNIVVHTVSAAEYKTDARKVRHIRYKD